METKPLVIFTDSTNCDDCGHCATVWTDGLVAYALTFSDGTRASVEFDGLLRDGETITGSCPLSREHGPDEQCPGSYTWRLDTEGTWDAPTMANLSILRDAYRLEVA